MRGFPSPATTAHCCGDPHPFRHATPLKHAATTFAGFLNRAQYWLDRRRVGNQAGVAVEDCGRTAVSVVGAAAALATSANSRVPIPGLIRSDITTQILKAARMRLPERFRHDRCRDMPWSFVPLGQCILGGYYRTRRSSGQKYGSVGLRYRALRSRCARLTTR